MAAPESDADSSPPSPSDVSAFMTFDSLSKFVHTFMTAVFGKGREAVAIATAHSLELQRVLRRISPSDLISVL